MESRVNSYRKIITGLPQNVQDGAVFLGLTTWHLYPDMCVLGVGQDTIKQRDPLVPQSAIITLGLASHLPDSDSGAHWSLPL